MFEDNFKTTKFEYSQRQKGPRVCLPKGLNTTELTLGLIDWADQSILTIRAEKKIVGKPRVKPCQRVAINVPSGKF